MPSVRETASSLRNTPELVGCRHAPLTAAEGEAAAAEEEEEALQHPT